MSANALIESLHGLRRRVKAFAVAYGVALVVALAVGILLAILLIDYELGLDPSGRLMLMLVGLGAWGYALWHWVVRPVMAKVTISHIAGSLEHAYPQFDDRLRSTVDFVDNDIPGSQTMKERVVDQATEMARGVNLDQVIVGRPVYLSIAGAAVAVVLLIVLAGIAGKEGVLGIALNRLALGHDQWPKSVQIALASELPSHVTAGQHIDVAVRLAKGDRESRKAMLEYRYGDTGQWQQLVMARGADGVYTAALDARLPADEKSATLQTRITSGDGELDKNIGVVPKLEIADVEAGVTPPAYVQPQRPATVDLTQRPAIAVQGSQIVLHFSFNKNLAAGVPIELRPIKDPSAPESDKPAPIPADMKWDTNAAAGTAVATFHANASFRFTVHATDVDHFNNIGSEEYQVIVREDQLPTVQIEEPRHSDDYAPSAKFAIHAVADDDYGVAAARLIVKRIATQEGTAPSTPSNQWIVDLVQGSKAKTADVDWQQADSSSERRRYTLGYDWDLAALDKANLKPGDVLEYSLQVKDNFSLNGKDHDWVSSGKLRATIVSLDQIKTDAQQQLQQLAQAIEATRKAQDLNKLDTKSLQDTLNQRKKYDEADQNQVDRLANQQNNLAVQTQQVSDKLTALDKKLDENQVPEQDPLRQSTKNGSQALQNVVNSPMHQAKESINGAKDAPPPDAKATPDQKAQDAGQRNQKLAESSKHQQQASDDLAAAQKLLGDFNDIDKMAAEIGRIEHEQKELNEKYPKKLGDTVGQKPQDMNAQQKHDLNELTDKQNDLKKQTENAINSMTQKGNQPKPSDPDAANAMKAAAQQGQQDNVTGQQGQSSDSMQQNQQNNAQKAQEQADLGLKRMEEILDKEKLAQLAKLQEKLAKIQQLLQELAQRQAGHNMDNLLLQGGPNRVTGLKPATDEAQLFEVSLRDVKDLPTMHPELGSLTKSQEQTTLNARSLLKDTDELKDPTASAKIEAAASQMERAAVELQNNRLADAYDPPQTEALRDLLAAKEAIDHAKQKADEEANKKKKDSIRQAYQALLDDQKKLDAQTPLIDKLPKNDDGSLSRAAIGQARPLPAGQQKLSDRAKDIGEDLKGLGSVVYSWANDDIISSMADVKDDLTKPDTGTATQAEQQRIEDQLQAMIDELKEVPPEKSKFEKNGGGGGGGGGGGKPKPKMPTDAELRLLKDLQLSINKNTKTLAGLPTPDAHRLTALGHREGSIRSLFDQMIQNATKGKVKLNPPPNDSLPDTATDKDIDNQELDNNLLGQNADDDSVTQGVKTTGDRMARVDQRLAANKDPGQVTQDIEGRIVAGIDDMIKLAQQQQPQGGSGKPDPSQKPGDPGQAQPGSGSGPQTASKSHQEHGTNAAQQSTMSQGGPPQVDDSKLVQDHPDQWGHIPPRNHRALLETTGEHAIGRYSNQVNDYYKNLSQAASKQQNQ